MIKALPSTQTAIKAELTHALSVISMEVDPVILVDSYIL